MEHVSVIICSEPRARHCRPVLLHDTYISGRDECTGPRCSTAGSRSRSMMCMWLRRKNAKLTSSQVCIHLRKRSGRPRFVGQLGPNTAWLHLKLWVSAALVVHCCLLCTAALLQPFSDVLSQLIRSLAHSCFRCQEAAALCQMCRTCFREDRIQRGSIQQGRLRDIIQFGGHLVLVLFCSFRSTYSQCVGTK